MPRFGSIVPGEVWPVTIVGSDQVTTWQSLVGTVLSHPGLLTVAAKVKVSVVPTVAVVGLIEMVMPEIIVTAALAVLVESACAVAVIVAVGVITGSPFEMTVGITFGAVYTPFVSMVPQAGAVTPVGQVTVHVDDHVGGSGDERGERLRGIGNHAGRRGRNRQGYFG